MSSGLKLKELFSILTECYINQGFGHIWLSARNLDTVYMRTVFVVDASELTRLLTERADKQKRTANTTRYVDRIFTNNHVTPGRFLDVAVKENET